MIIFDTETTGLVKPKATPVKNQPELIEFAGIKLDDKTLDEVERLEFLCRPKIKLPKEITKITGLTDKDLEGAKPFTAWWKELAGFFTGERIMVAHNVAFDRNILALELGRIDKLTNFPWPIEHLCTAELTLHIKKHRLTLSSLHQLLIFSGKDFEDKHRAMADTEALTRCVRELRTRKIL